MRRRVAITGLGLVTPLGNDTAATWDAMLKCQSGIAPIRLFDAAGYPVRIAAEVKAFEPALARADRKLRKYAVRHTRFALAAAEQALEDAGIRPQPATSIRWGCVVGSGMMGVEFGELAQFQRDFAPGGILTGE